MVWESFFATSPIWALLPKCWSQLGFLYHLLPQSWTRVHRIQSTIFYHLWHLNHSSCSFIPISLDLYFVRNTLSLKVPNIEIDFDVSVDSEQLHRSWIQGFKVACKWVFDVKFWCIVYLRLHKVKNLMSNLNATLCTFSDGCLWPKNVGENNWPRDHLIMSQLCKPLDHHHFNREGLDVIKVLDLWHCWWHKW